MSFLRPAVRRVLEALPDCLLVNGYRPTETTTFAVCHPLEWADTDRMRIPIGRPIAHTVVCLLDEALRSVPDGAVGERCIAPGGLARGYLDDPVGIFRSRSIRRAGLSLVPHW
jgi:non-ribosomal peptide synthetase component F